MDSEEELIASLAAQLQHNADKALTTEGEK